MSRFARRTDENQAAIVNALRQVGCSVQSLAAVGDGCPDLLVGWRHLTHVLEVKDGDKAPSDQKLTPAQKQWHRQWVGRPVVVVRDISEALRAVGVIR